MLTFSHGIDLVENARIAQMLEKHGEQFLHRCFTEAERAYCMESEKLRDQRLAARFAAKEAVLKAMGTGWSNGIAWTEIEVLRLPSGEPTLKLAGRAAEIAAERGFTDFQISLSHTDQHAVASVIASR